MTQSRDAMPREGFLPRSRLQRLFDVLSGDGYTIVGPTIDQEAIVYDELDSVDDLPRGWTDQQGPGTYRLTRTDKDLLFDYVVGPHSWKRYLFPPHLRLSAATNTADGWRFDSCDQEPPKLALLGVRACELAAIQVQDRVFLGGPAVDPDYQRRRAATLVIAVNCTSAAPTCFCTSMGTGPRCSSGFDLALTEVAEGFVVEAGTGEGRELLDRLPLDEPTPAVERAAEDARRRAVDQIERQLDTDGIRDLLFDNVDHPRWDDVAERCLSCTNCTMVCPTCFCSSVEEVSDLAGDQVERHRHWDSCFNFDFSYINGGPVRNQIRSRYRQWLTHKLASWHDQFDSSGCVGCGRCITWCPVGIDLTEEVAAIRETS